LIKDPRQFAFVTGEVLDPLSVRVCTK